MLNGPKIIIETTKRNLIDGCSLASALSNYIVPENNGFVGGKSVGADIELILKLGEVEFLVRQNATGRQIEDTYELHKRFLICTCRGCDGNCVVGAQKRDIIGFTFYSPTINGKEINTIGLRPSFQDAINFGMTFAKQCKNFRQKK